jgi:hypothetical protein
MRHYTSFVFKCNRKPCSYQCKLDLNSWKSCKSPKSYSSLALGDYTFKVRAKNPATNLWDKSPASWPWTIASKWTAISSANAPSPREQHLTVWTGSTMILWGGLDANTGAVYDPVANSWTALSTANVPAGRIDATAIWTGTQMLIWGGATTADYSSGFLGDGKRYDPITNTWTNTIFGGGSAPSARYGHVAVWKPTNSSMLIWGGCGSACYSDGMQYTPIDDSWGALSNTNTPSARRNAAAVWTDLGMVIWGGYDGTNNLNNGGRYYGSTWYPVSTTNAPTARENFAYGLAASRLFIWGGQNHAGTTFFNSGAIYNHGTDSWSVIETAGAPSPRSYASAAWTGTSLIIWGGYDGSLLGGGAKYTP